MAKSNNATHQAIHKAFSINDVVNVRINRPPDMHDSTKKKERKRSDLLKKPILYFISFF
jgi:hypothetical protein